MQFIASNCFTVYYKLFIIKVSAVNRGIAHACFLHRF